MLSRLPRGTLYTLVFIDKQPLSDVPGPVGAHVAIHTHIEQAKQSEWMRVAFWRKKNSQQLLATGGTMYNDDD